jgi:hypothetical protein
MVDLAPCCHRVGDRTLRGRYLWTGLRAGRRSSRACQCRRWSLRSQDLEGRKPDPPAHSRKKAAQGTAHIGEQFLGLLCPTLPSFGPCGTENDTPSQCAHVLNAIKNSQKSRLITVVAQEFGRKSVARLWWTGAQRFRTHPLGGPRQGCSAYASHVASPPAVDRIESMPPDPSPECRLGTGANLSPGYRNLTLLIRW